MNQPPRIFISAAESSGDANAAALAAAILKLAPNTELHGIGGRHMASAGVKLLAESTSKAAMGIAAATRIFESLKLLRSTRDFYTRSPPDLAICVDSWSLNKHFAKLARQFGRPVLYFVAPQAWAWRQGRVKTMRQCIDHLACLLPFEAPWYTEHGLAASYVGHPLFDKLPIPRPRSYDPAKPPTIGLLTGSRESEVTKNWPRLLEVACQLSARFPGCKFVVPSNSITHPRITQSPLPATIAANTLIRQDEFDSLVPTCDLCITVSGTATLHVALHGVPMLIVYAGSRLLWEALGRFIIPTRTFGLINLLAANAPRPHPDTQIMPEFIPWHGPVAPVVDTASRWLSDPTLLRQKSMQLVEVIRSIHRPDSAAAAAHLALDLIQNRTRR